MSSPATNHNHLFDADTAVTAAGEGTYKAALTDRWDRYGGGPNGGYVVSVALRALQEALPHPDPLTVTAHFLRLGSHGDAVIDTEVLKVGRTLAYGRAILSQADRPVLAVSAAFGNIDSFAGTTQLFNAAPQMPSPEDCRDPLAGLVVGDVTSADRIDLRYATPVGWPDMQPNGLSTAEYWVRLRDGREPDLSTIPLFVDINPPTVLELGQPGSTTIELTTHFRSRPAPGWLACRASTRHLLNGLHDEDVEVWDSEGTLVAQSRQLALITQPPTAADGTPTWVPPSA
jgi:acyl-CoA thioesterase